jgi:spermidine synthase
MFARNSYWCIVRTLEAAGFVVKPYYTAVPSFGLWGFALASSSPFEIPTKPPDGLRFLDEQTLAAMFRLSKDIEPVPVEINRLDNQALVRYYEGEWRKFE